ncbi:unnamed protein product [Adineta steineri]|uniref:C3H1-type domain-containing protein n=1 Tax=Adineta steineri TaxID=433720 RepID=A0A819T2H9_9BILA|nr:unnamed protein product [Adineta steineri]CAF4071672.1 unnamed protein product [Adineta steineri]
MGYNYELIKSVIQQQTDGDDMSKFIETIVRTAEVNSNSNISSSSSSMKTFSPQTKTDTDCSDTTIPHDVYMIDGADLAFSFQSLLVRIINDDDDGNDCETHCSLCLYGKKCTYRLKCNYFHIERLHQNLFSITESLHMKARLEKSKIQHYLSTPTMINNNRFNHTTSGPKHLHMYSSPIMDQTLADDTRIAYEYGLTSTPISNDFSFVLINIFHQFNKQDKLDLIHQINNIHS